MICVCPWKRLSFSFSVRSFKLCVIIPFIEVFTSCQFRSGLIPANSNFAMHNKQLEMFGGGRYKNTQKVKEYIFNGIFGRDPFGSASDKWFGDSMTVRTMKM